VMLFFVLNTGCVTTEFLSSAETAGLFDSRGKKDYEKCFLAEMAPADAPLTADPSHTVVVTVVDRRPEYRNYAPLAFVFFVPFAHGEVPGLIGCAGVYERCADYRHVFGMLVAKQIQSMDSGIAARYEDSGRVKQTEHKLKIHLADFHTDSTIYSYGLGPFCGVAWMLALPMGSTGVDAEGGWELLAPSGIRLGGGTFSMHSRKTISIYYSTTAQAYSRDGVIGQSLHEISSGIARGVTEALAAKPTPPVRE